MEQHLSRSLETLEKNNNNPCILRTVSVGGKIRYPLAHEGDVQVYRITHRRSLLQKVVTAKILRRWEWHKIILADKTLNSASPKGYMTYGLPYNEIQEVITGTRNGMSYTVHLIIPCSGSLIFQFSNAYARDQWFISLVWKITACRFRNLNKKKGEDLKKELKELVSFCTTSPISDPIVTQLPLNTVSLLLMEHGHEYGHKFIIEVLEILSPLLENSLLTSTTCKCFQRISQHHPSIEIDKIFLSSVHRILKHNSDFGKLPHLRMFLQDYLYFIFNQSEENIKHFILGIHTSNNTCPHQRVLPNIVTVSLACIFSLYEEPNMPQERKEKLSKCFKEVLREIVKYKDWLLPLAILLQAVPFPKEALEDPSFSDVFGDIIEAFATDDRCDTHQLLLPIRDKKDGWIHHFAPGGVCFSDGVFFSKLMSYLTPCCYKRKKTLIAIKHYIRGLFSLMAIRGDKYCIEELITLLEFDLIEDTDETAEIISAVLSSDEGKRQYELLCQKRTKFKEMKEAGGPRKLTLPSQSTDADLKHVLQSGAVGNLESLNLAFTRVTSNSAKEILELPSLIHLNLWATPFDDEGLHTLAEHNKLQSLNLCETPVTDKGLRSLVCLTTLRCLNVNSTKITQITFEYLKENLKLFSVDVGYTEAYTPRVK